MSRTRWRSGALIAAAAVGALGVGLAAAPAVAHTPTWSVTCDEVSLELTNYGHNARNTVTVTVDGKDLLPTETFTNDFSRTLKLPEHDKEVSVRLVITASDGDQYGRDETKTAPVCEDESPTPTPTPTPPSPTPSDTPSETPSTSAPATPAPAPSTSSPGLAETGSSSSTPLIAAAAAVVIAAGGGITWAARRRRGVQD
ncbi:LPXTG cell wall anchor domain-containing protein [Streptomyces sp. PKU-EA00015]|nr:LAETG motif-containing sortase-dependent surface protein [Streptomyces sp. PKU-EA00015]NWF25416.1 LPXTG cell wall anchor domain-containing protein [Streptomyces sp. PKU-EA00015]